MQWNKKIVAGVSYSNTIDLLFGFSLYFLSVVVMYYGKMDMTL